MNAFKVTRVRQDGDLVMVTLSGSGSPPELREFHFPTDALEGRMGEYELSDPSEAFDVLIHEPLLWEYIASIASRDDPATVAGWVTTDNPDAEPVTLHNARSGADARGAHRARIAATKVGRGRVWDPDGLLAPLHTRPLDHDLIEHHRQRVGVSRWELVYGGLPLRPPAAGGHIPIQMRG